MKFGILNLSLFTGMVYEEKRQEERTVTVEQARQVVAALQTTGAVDRLGAKSSPPQRSRKSHFPRIWRRFVRPFR